MRNILLAALAVSTGLAVVASGPAEARCFRTGHHWSCGHHRALFSERAAYRHVAGGYGYTYPYYGSGYGYYGSSYPYYGSSSSSAATMGPAPHSDGGS